LRDSVKAKREIDLQWRACQGCPYIVQIKDVYENVINNQRVLLVVMECMLGGELFAKISERTQPFTEQGKEIFFFTPNFLTGLILKYIKMQK
jgi:mitogen-activated protein kinase-activated protein kinase 2